MIIIEDKLNEFLKENNLDPEFIYIYRKIDLESEQEIVPIWLIADEQTLLSSGIFLFFDDFELFKKDEIKNIDPWLLKRFAGKRRSFRISIIKSEYLIGQVFPKE